MTDIQVLQQVLTQMQWATASTALLIALLVSVAVQVAAYFIRKRTEQGIARDLEDFRSRLSQNERKVQAVLDTTSHVRRAQFEVEFAAYREIWASLFEAQVATTTLRPVFDVALGPSESAEERKMQRLTAFIEAYNPFSEIVESRLPFYPQDIYTKLAHVRDIMSTEATEYRQFPENNSEYWPRAMKNSKELRAAIEEAALAIRTRLESISVID